jgi:plastocyanin
MATQVSPNVAAPVAASGDRFPFRPIIIVSLLLVSLAGGVSQVLSGHVIPPEMGYTIGALVAAGLVALPWRWAMILPCVLSIVGLAGGLTNGFPEYALAHAADVRVAFLGIACQYGLLLLVIGLCVAQFVQTLRDQARQAPRWVGLATTAMTGVIIGAMFIGAIAQPSGASGSGSVTTGTETVHLVGAQFAPNIIALHRGDTLTVVDDSPTPHILANGTWSASNQAQPGAEPGAPTINNVQLNNNTVVLGPFTTPGTYHIYCLVHPGMNLTVIVQ